jgi:hypothetical protein
MVWKLVKRISWVDNLAMEHFTTLIEIAHPWLYRASIYAANAFLDDPAILAFAFC